ncbi:MAG: MarR family transcriptional regulator [Alsobacter sp.]
MAQVSASEALDLIQLISGVNKRLEQAVGARLKPTGIAVEQYRVLRELERADGRTMGDLAAAVFVDAPTLTKIIDRMIAAGLVYRSPDARDRRKVLILISESGQATLADLKALVEAPEDRLVGPLAPGEIRQLRSLLKNLLP